MMKCRIVPNSCCRCMAGIAKVDIVTSEEAYNDSQNAQEVAKI